VCVGGPGAYVLPVGWHLMGYSVLHDSVSRPVNSLSVKHVVWLDLGWWGWCG
jgi:hypothetical protein